ncbi:MAG: hypothetical protein ACI4LB_01270 [Candidatus Fimenecus sp.]
MKLARFYLHHKFLYYFLWWLALTTICCLPIFLVWDEFLSNVLSYGLLCIGIIGMLSAELKVQLLTKLLVRQCDPVAYLQQTDYLLAGLDLSKKITSGYRNAECVTILINRTAAFCDLGRFEEATEIFRFLQNNAGNRLLPMQMMAIYHNLAYISAQRGDMSFAECYAGEERAAWKKCKPIAKSVKAQRWLAETGTAALLLQKQGKVSEALAVYTQMEQFLQTQKKPVLREQVGTAFEAGALYYQLEKYSDAVPRLQFVFEHGGTTVYRAKAAELLQEIQTKTI